MVDRVLLHMRRLGSRKENLDDYTSEAEIAPRNLYQHSMNRFVERLNIIACR